MRRRTFVICALAGLAAPGSVAAQKRRSMPLVGVTLARPIPNEFMKAFQRGLRELGYVEGQNIQVEYRSVEGRPERYAIVAAEFVALEVDVIVAGGSVMAAKAATSTIPIVFPAQPDPVSMGLVQSLARPGGNVTGISMLEADVSAKRLELVRELLPKAQRIAVLRDPRVPAQQVDAIQAAARNSSIDVHILSFAPDKFDQAFAEASRVRAQAMIVLPSSSFSAQRHRLVELAAKSRLIAVYEYDGYPLAGGLISYGVNFEEMYRAAARYVDKILKGAKPAELPVEQATKFDLVINLKAAKALGLAIPPSLLLRADRVIE